MTIFRILQSFFAIFMTIFRISKDSGAIFVNVLGFYDNFKIFKNSVAIFTILDCQLSFFCNFYDNFQDFFKNSVAFFTILESFFAIFMTIFRIFKDSVAIFEDLLGFYDNFQDYIKFCCYFIGFWSYICNFMTIFRIFKYYRQLLKISLHFSGFWVNFWGFLCNFAGFERQNLKRHLAAVSETKTEYGQYIFRPLDDRCRQLTTPLPHSYHFGSYQTEYLLRPIAAGELFPCVRTLLSLASFLLFLSV